MKIKSALRHPRDRFQPSLKETKQIQSQILQIKLRDLSLSLSNRPFLKRSKAKWIRFWKKSHKSHVEDAAKRILKSTVLSPFSWSNNGRRSSRKWKIKWSTRKLTTNSTTKWRPWNLAWTSGRWSRKLKAKRTLWKRSLGSWVKFSLRWSTQIAEKEFWRKCLVSQSSEERHQHSCIQKKRTPNPLKRLLWNLLALKRIKRLITETFQVTRQISFLFILLDFA